MIMKTAAGYNVNRIITYTITQHIAAVLYSITKRCLVSQVMKEEKHQHKKHYLSKIANLLLQQLLL